MPESNSIPLLIESKSTGNLGHKNDYFWKKRLPCWNWTEQVRAHSHPLRAGLGAIDTDDAEMLRADFLDPDMNDPRGLLQDLPTTRPRTLTDTSCGHDGLPP